MHSHSHNPIPRTHAAHSIDRLWNGLYLESFSELLELFPSHGLTFLDVGTGRGLFPEQLATKYPGRFSNGTGIDYGTGPDRTMECGSTRLSLNYGVNFHTHGDTHAGAYDLLFFNCTAIPIDSDLFYSNCQRLLRPGGAVVATFFWEPFLTPAFDAFDKPQDTVDCLARIMAPIANREKYRCWQLIDIDSLPPTDYRPVPSAAVFYPNGLPNHYPVGDTRARAMTLLAQHFTSFESCWCNHSERGLSINLYYPSGCNVLIEQAMPMRDEWTYVTDDFFEARGPLCEVIQEVKTDLCGRPRRRVISWE